MTETEYQQFNPYKLYEKLRIPALAGLAIAGAFIGISLFDLVLYNSQFFYSLRFSLFFLPYSPHAYDTLYYSVFYVLLYRFRLRYWAPIGFLFVWSLDEITSPLINVLNVPKYAALDPTYFYKLSLFVIICAFFYAVALHERILDMSFPRLPLICGLFIIYFAVAALDFVKGVQYDLIASVSYHAVYLAIFFWTCKPSFYPTPTILKH